MGFEIVGDLSAVETFARGRAIRELARLIRAYGKGRWRKRKGIAKVRLLDGTVTLAELHWYEADMKLTVSGEKSSRSSGIWMSNMATPRASKQRFVICLRNDGYPASLERLKVYRALRDTLAARHGQLRVIDESGEDYLYPAELFEAIDLPPPVRRAVMAA